MQKGQPRGDQFEQTNEENTGGWLCIYIYGILNYDNDKQEEYVRIGRVETKQVKTDKVIRVGVPVEIWIAGELLFFAVALGK